MDKHKQTPDILAEILGGEATGAMEPAAAAPPRPAVKTKPPAQTKRSSSAPRKAPDAPKWEYKLVTFHSHNGWRPRYINGEELPDWMDRPLIHEFTSQLGEEGWELTAASSGERMYGLNDKYQLYFKRLR